jgi:ABC-2 type transport system permease protein
MKKFTNLLLKEIRELATLQLVISLAFTMGLFYFMGEIAKKEAIRAEATQKISALDLDGSELSKGVLDGLRMARFKISPVTETTKEAAVEAAKKSDASLLLVIPEGFGESVARFQPKEIESYTYLRGFSLSGLRKSEVFKAIVTATNNYLSSDFLRKKLPDYDPEALKNPIKSRDFVIVKDRMAQGSASAIAGFVYSQSIFVPIILMMIIIYSSQMVISAIAMEKQNKTLETLLTVPIKRTSIVTAKMMAAGLVGLLSAVIYMVGFKSYMGGMMGGRSLSAGAGVDSVVRNLGLVLDARGYLLLGVSLFFAILCALAMATILGVLAEDFRSAQSLIMPVIFLVLIPYFLSFFADVRALSTPVRLLVLAIPFSHPFLASQNILLEEYAAVYYGILYMAVFFAVLVYLAARIFSTDRVLTMKLRWGKKKIVL